LPGIVAVVSGGRGRGLAGVFVPLNAGRFDGNGVFIEMICSRA
jgi:hypothetical protein